MNGLHDIPVGLLGLGRSVSMIALRYSTLIVKYVSNDTALHLIHSIQLVSSIYNGMGNSVSEFKSLPSGYSGMVGTRKHRPKGN